MVEAQSPNSQRTGKSLAGKTAFVTGAASGIGRASAILLQSEDAFVVAVDRDAEGLAALGNGFYCVVADLANGEKVVEAAQKAIALDRGIDILVNSAGITGNGGSLLDQKLETWSLVHAVNCTAPFLLIRELGREMVRRGVGGRIVNITSSSAHRARSSQTAYGSSKAALAQLTRIAAAELGEHDINVNAIAPGLTRTPIVDRAFTPEVLAQALVSGPIANLLGRISEPEDIANAVLFLCQPASRQITGQNLQVSAGAITA